MLCGITVKLRTNYGIAVIKSYYVKQYVLGPDNAHCM